VSMREILEAQAEDEIKRLMDLREKTLKAQKAYEQYREELLLKYIGSTKITEKHFDSDIHLVEAIESHLAQELLKEVQGEID